MVRIAWTCTALVVLALGCAAQAEQFPTRPVRLVLGFPAGGPTDAAAAFVKDQIVSWAAAARDAGIQRQ